MNHLGLALGLVFGTTATAMPARAADPLSEVGHLLTTHSRLCADFTQSKVLRALVRPLIMQGRIDFRADKGILWTVRAPFPAQYLITNNALINLDDSGRAEHISFDQSPVLRILSHLFIALFTGKLSALRNNFKIETQLDSTSWKLTLSPKDAVFSAIIAQVRAEGGQFVDELHIVEGHGDRTNIKFKNLTVESCNFDGTEKTYFSR